MTNTQWVGLASELMGVLAVTMLLTISPRFKNQRPLVFLYPLREGIIALGLFASLLALSFMVYNNPDWTARIVPQVSAAAQARLDQQVALSLVAALLIGALLLYRRQPLRSAGWNRPLLTAALQVGIASVLLTIFLRGMLLRLIDGAGSGQGSTLLFVIITVVLEETLFRGYIQLRLSGWLGDIAGWLAASSLFVLWQIPRLTGLAGELFLTQLAVSLAQGLLAGWMMMKCRHVLAPALYRSASAWLLLLM